MMSSRPTGAAPPADRFRSGVHCAGPSGPPSLSSPTGSIRLTGWPLLRAISGPGQPCSVAATTPDHREVQPAPARRDGIADLVPRAASDTVESEIAVLTAQIGARECKAAAPARVDGQVQRRYRGHCGGRVSFALAGLPDLLAAGFGRLSAGSGRQSTTLLFLTPSNSAS